MTWRDFIPTEVIRVIVRHFIADFLAILAFGILAKLAEYFFQTEPIKQIIHLTEIIGVILLLGFLIFCLILDIIETIQGNKNE